MGKQQYRLEVRMHDGEWNQVGYESISEDLDFVKQSYKSHSYQHPDKDYRIVYRDVSDWEEVKPVLP